MQTGEPQHLLIATNDPVVFDKSTKEVEEVTINLNIGDEKITKVVNMRNELEKSRD